MILIKIADAATAAEREFKPSDYASEKLSGCVNEKRRREIILGDYVRGSLLLDASVEGETIALGRHGKPYLTDRSDVTFNVSHSGMLAVGIVATDAEGEVGIDVERIDRSRGEDRKNRIMRRVFTDAETTPHAILWRNFTLCGRKKKRISNIRARGLHVRSSPSIQRRGISRALFAPLP